MTRKELEKLLKDNFSEDEEVVCKLLEEDGSECFAYRFEVERKTDIECRGHMEFLAPDGEWRRVDENDCDAPYLIPSIYKTRHVADGMMAVEKKYIVPVVEWLSLTLEPEQEDS